MTDPRRNVELKARCADLAAARGVVQQLGARAAGVEVQADTYFRVGHGRLKLREIEGQSAVLIWYARPDADQARISSYYLVPVPEPEALKAALAAALGVRGEVRKRRTIYLWHNVRIHLDKVAGLGNFVEFEAVLGADDDEATAHAHLRQLGAAWPSCRSISCLCPTPICVDGSDPAPARPPRGSVGKDNGRGTGNHSPVPRRVSRARRKSLSSVFSSHQSPGRSGPQKHLLALNGNP